MNSQSYEYEKVAKKMTTGQHTLKELGLKPADIRKMRDQGYQVYDQVFRGQHIYFIPHGVENPYIFLSGKSAKQREYTWLELSDLHAGCKQFDHMGLERIMSLASKEGFNEVHVSGDIGDGIGVYPGHHTNLRYSTALDQAQVVFDIFSQFPKLKYRLIKGNHDFSFEKRGSPSPCKLLADMLREVNIECTFMNAYSADMVIGGVVKRMVHLSGGTAYAKSYPGQVYIRNLVDSHGLNIRVNGNKYRIRFLQLGHLHTSIHYESAGIECTHPGNFQFPNDYTQRKGLVGPQGARFTRTVVIGDDVVKYRSDFIKARDY